MVALERMRELTLEIILRVVFGARDEQEVARAARRDRGHARRRSLAAADAGDGGRAQRDLGPRSPWGRFRIAVERFDALLFELLARRRAEPRSSDSVLALLLEQRDEHGNPPTDQHLRDQLVALLVGGHDSSAASLAWAFERLARHPAVQARLREGDPAYLDAVVKEVLRARPALTIAPRLLLEPARIAGRTVPAGVQVAACLWLALRREDLWPRAPARSGPSAGSTVAPRRIRCRGSRSAAASGAAPARRSPRWRCGRSCARPPDLTLRPVAPGARARAAQHARAVRIAAARCSPADPPEQGRRDSVHARMPRTLGNTDLEVTPLGLGLAALGPARLHQPRPRRRPRRPRPTSPRWSAVRHAVLDAA